MSLAQVLKLEDYRGKRVHRLRLADTLYSADPKRLEVFRHLVEVAELCVADRAATVWVDEYGAGSVHPHVVLDHAADRPRRYFSSEPLRRAWELGVPGAVDALSDPGSAVPTTFAISLGSDGMRAWFLVAESTSARPLLGAEVRDRLMFLAGECAAVLLHRELDRMLPVHDQPDEGGFAGWPILQDLEGRESDEEAGRRIAQRFVVGRVARMLVEDDLVIDAERMAEQVRRARVELPVDWDPADAEVALWYAVLDALESGDLPALGEALLTLGECVERQQHAHGALELYACAYEVATAAALAGVAARASWFSGRLLRRRASWDEAREMYSTAHRIAEVAGLTDVSVHTLVGLSVMKQDLGNLPAARKGLEEALELAEATGVNDSIAVVHHSFMGLEQVAGDPARGLTHGWIAVSTYETEERRTACMAGLAAALIDYGDRVAAEDAWALVAHSAKDGFYRIYATDAMGHLAALRGDENAFEVHSARCDDLGWESVSGTLKAEIILYRGLSYRALGRFAEAEQWLRRAVTFTEEHRLNRLLFEAEDALRSLAEARNAFADPGPTPAAPAELREGLRSMRQELVEVGT